MFCLLRPFLFALLFNATIPVASVWCIKYFAFEVYSARFPPAQRIMICREDRCYVPCIPTRTQKGTDENSKRPYLDTLMFGRSHTTSCMCMSALLLLTASLNTAYILLSFHFTLQALVNIEIPPRSKEALSRFMLYVWHVVTHKLQ